MKRWPFIFVLLLLTFSVSAEWLSYDPSWNERDPNGQSYCGGDPVNYFDSDGRLGKGIGPNVLDQFENSQQGDAVDAYNQTQAQMADFEEGLDFGEPGGEQSFSSLLDMVPVVGGLKMWWELGTGVDSVTGQRIQTSDWTEAALIGLSFLPIAVEAAPEEAALEAEVNGSIYGAGQEITSEGMAVDYGALENAGGGDSAPVLDQLGRDDVDIAEEGVAAEGTAPNLLAPYTGVNPWAGELQSVVAAQDTTMYRVWGGGSQQMGAWLTPSLPTSAAQATGDLALPAANTASFYSEVVVPAGTRYQIGTAAPAFGQAGGGVQVQLLQQIPAGNFGPGIALPP